LQAPVAVDVRSPKLNTLAALIVALVLGGAVALLELGGARGGRGVEQTLNQALAAGGGLRSGRLDLSFSVSSRGASALPAARSLRVQGPFQSGARGRLPSFALTLVARDRHDLRVAVTSTGRQLFVALRDMPFVAPESTLRELAQRYSQASAGAGASGPGAVSGAMRVDPRRWLIAPRREGSARVDGVSTVHIGGGLDLARFLIDVDRVGGAGAVLAPGSSGAHPARITAAQQAALARSLSSSHVDVYAGSRDHLLRVLRATATLNVPLDARVALGGLTEATMTFELAFSDVNRAQVIVAPAHPRPAGALLAALSALESKGARAGAHRATGGP